MFAGPQRDERKQQIPQFSVFVLIVAVKLKFSAEKMRFTAAPA